ncbi:MAG: protein translocase subunit SecD [Solirubrobacteraceae bacterium]|nr:protein translocase subunit SecD [Solirubrobacteraceae bacterium]
MSERRRNLFILLFVAGLAIASLVVVNAKSARLGLDLRGGVELVYKATPAVGTGAVDPDSLDRAIEVMRKRVDPTGTLEPEIQTAGDSQITIALPGYQNPKKAQDLVGRTARLYFYDWEPNVVGPEGTPAPEDPAVTGATDPGGPTAALTKFDAVIRASKRPAKTYAQRSHNETYYLVNDKERKVLVGPTTVADDLYSEDPAEAAKQKEGTRVVKVPTGTTLLQATAPTAKSGSGKANARPDKWFVVQDDVALQGSDIRDPVQSQDQLGQPAVAFQFSDKGKKIWQDVTRAIAERGQEQAIGGTGNQHFAVALDNQLLTVPYIDAQRNPDGISGDTGAEISGSLTLSEARELADLLRSGALPVNLQQLSQSQVSATLGQKALDKAVVAGLVGFAVVALFLLVFYRVLGVLAISGLALYTLFFYALVKAIPITLTLPGIAGLILTIGVAADANIVIFERIKEELRAGRSVSAAISAGYKRGLTAIADANVVTFMVAFILFTLATGGIKGFAFTLGVGTLVSFFTAVVYTQAVLGMIGTSRVFTSRAAFGAGEKTRPPRRFDFMGRSKVFFSLSGVILLIGAFAIGTNGVPLGNDFSGGTKIGVELGRSATEAQVRESLAADGFEAEKVQRETGSDVAANSFQITIKKLAPDRVPAVRASLEDSYGIGQNYEVQSVGPTFGKQIANTAIIAIIASLLVISAYIALRFEWKYAVPVLIALSHDILIVAGVYALIGAEVTSATVAALLTILGYSLYDTIIVFDRIRENVPRMPRATFGQIVNSSMSEVLTRSLATSFCTLLPVTALYFLGGETLQDFALALIIGTLSGAYSSIFIAAPVLVHWKERETVWKRRFQTVAAEHGGKVPSYADGPKSALATQERTGPVRLSSDQAPDQVSEEEFNEMVRDLGIEPEKKAAPAKAQPKPQSAPSATATAEIDPNDPAAVRRAEAQRRREARQNRTKGDS